ncbi:hypothetical protein MTO96_026371 [Rhipicephalus appendiculatus]
MERAFGEFEFSIVQPVKRNHDAHALDQLQVSVLDVVAEVENSDWLTILNTAASTEPPLTRGSPVLADCLGCLNATVRSFAAQTQYAAVYVYSPTFLRRSATLFTRATSSHPREPPSHRRRVCRPPVTCCRPCGPTCTATLATARFRRTHVLLTFLPGSASLATQTLITTRLSSGDTEQRTPTALSFPDVSTADVFLYNTTLGAASPQCKEPLPRYRFESVGRLSPHCISRRSHEKPRDDCDIQ